MSKKYWLRGGIIGAIIYAALGLFSFGPLYVITYPISVILYLPVSFIDFGISTLLSGIILGFILGSVAGWIYGNNKNRNQVGTTMK